MLANMTSDLFALLFVTPFDSVNFFFFSSLFSDHDSSAFDRLQPLFFFSYAYEDREGRVSGTVCPIVCLFICFIAKNRGVK